MPTMLDSRGLTIERVLQLSSAKAAEEGMAPPPIDGDFPAFGKPYRSLTPDEFSIATSIAMERHRADWWFNNFFATRSSDLYEADWPSVLHRPSYSDDSVPRILPRDSQKPHQCLDHRQRHTVSPATRCRDYRRTLGS